MAPARRWLLGLLLAALSALSAAGQIPPVFSCEAAVAVPPLLRAEGVAEKLGDIILTCTGGYASEYTIGQPLPTANFTISLGTNVTSRLLNTTTVPNVTEALLLIDEPGSALPQPVPGTGPGAPQKVCGNALLGAGPGGCVQYPFLASSGIPVQSSSATSLTAPANIFQGIWNSVAPNQITFNNVPILPAVVNGLSRVYRFTNIHANIAGLPVAPGQTSKVNVSISISSSTELTLDNPVQVAGFVESSMAVGLHDFQGNAIQAGPALSECSSWSSISPIAILQFQEIFATAWEVRNNGGSGSSLTQNIPGDIYYTESGFTVPTPYGTAGLADYGTRLKATFHNVPTGVRMFVSVGNVANVSTPAPLGGTTAALVVSETAADGGSPTVPLVAPTTTVGGIPAAELQVDSTGTAEAVWEVTVENPALIDTADFVVYQVPASSPPIPAGLAAAAINVNMTYAPSVPPGLDEATAPWTNASNTLTQPRFNDLSAPQVLFRYVGCGVPSLSILVSHTGNFQQGGAAQYTITVSDAGPPTAGAITVTELPSTGISILSMSGQGWSCGGAVCTRGDVLAGGASYPPITVSATISANAANLVSNSVMVTGGGSGSATATDYAAVAAAAVLSSCPSLQFFGNGSQSCSITANVTTDYYEFAEAAASAITLSGGNWLFVSPNGQVPLPFAITVTVSASGLGPGVYTGNITVWGDTYSSTGPFNIPVTLQVSNCNAAVSPTSIAAPALGANGSIAVNIPAGCGVWEASSLADWITVNTTLNIGSAIVPYSIDANFGVARAGQILAAGQAVSVTQAAFTGLAFYPVTPCRVADTRANSGQTGAFGPPSLSAGASRDFPIPFSNCGIPSSALAYSLNATVVPATTLGYLTMWPSGQPQPTVSTLNSSNGAIVANAAIVPAGASGAVSVFASDKTDFILDINGYFAPPSVATSEPGLPFYPLTPCRLADTRNSTGALGGPALAGNSTRILPLASSPCGLPANAGAYSLNFTAVPPGPLDYLSAWATGQTQPVVSTLNALDGRIVANAALVPAGTNGAISVYASDPTNLVIDTNGYFGGLGNGSALYFYPLTPCRAADTRNATGALGGPTLAANATRGFPLLSSSCGIPANAMAYSLNITVVPQGPLLYLSAWPAGQTQPVVSTLNAQQGLPVANAAIVPAGANGAIDIFVPSTTDVIIDINGYFAYLQ